MKIFLIAICMMISVIGGMQIVDKKNCKTTVTGTDYVGTISQTMYGDPCQMWSSHYPHPHYYTGIFDYEFPENNVTEANNYCRNVNSDNYGPWCYTINEART